MKTKALTISILLLAIVLAPLAMAEEYGPRGPRGPRGGQGGPHDGYGQGRGPRGGYGQERGHFGGRPGMGEGGLGLFFLGRMGQRLNLTEEQKEQIKAIIETNKEDETCREKIHEAMKALNEAAAEGKEAEIIAAGKALGEAFTQQALKRADTMKQVKAVLTEEQLAQLEELKTEMKERMQQWREKGADEPRGRRGEGRQHGEGGRHGYGKRQRRYQEQQ